MLKTRCPVMKRSIFLNPDHMSKICLANVLVIFLFNSLVFAENPSEVNPIISEKNSKKFEEPVKQASIYDLSFEQLSKVEILTASEFTETALHVASSVSIINEKDWLRFGARRANDAISHLPGVSVLPHFGSGEVVSIRGYSNLAPRGVAMMLDGVPLNSFSYNTASYHLSNIGLVGLEKIEVVRGPVSVLYGTDAFHGVYSLKSSSKRTPGTKIFSEAGTDKYMTSGIQHTSVLPGNILNVSLQASGQGNQHERYHYTDPNTASFERATWKKKNEYFTGMFKLSSDRDDSWFYDAGLYWHKEDSDDFQGYGRFLDKQTQNTASRSEVRDLFSNENDFYMTKASVGYRFNHDIVATLSLFYWNTDFIQKRWLSRNTIGSLYNGEYRYGQKLTIKQAENSWNTQWSVTLGYDYNKVTTARDKLQDSAGLLISNNESIFKGYQREIKNIAFNAKTALFNYRLHLHYGARLDHYDSFGSELSPRLGLVYNPSLKSAVKLLYGRAFRAASAAEQGGTSNIAKGDNDIDPETIDTYELVFMYQAKDWQTELVFFHSRWEDAITTIPSSDPAFTVEYANSDENRSWGVEYSFNFSRTYWNMDYSASYIKSTNRARNEDYVTFPRLIQNIGFGFKIPSCKLEVYLSNRIMSNVHENPSKSSSKLNDYWQTDLNVQYRFSDRFRWMLNVRNLFDRKNELPTLFYTENGLSGQDLNVSLALMLTF
jgi:outer membrane receptor for ferrienterochelin and colicin